jgi:hypothetical protein
MRPTRHAGRRHSRGVPHAGGTTRSLRARPPARRPLGDRGLPLARACPAARSQVTLDLSEVRPRTGGLNATQLRL